MPGKARTPDVVEPGVVMDIFITGILPLEDHGENVRLIGYVEQRFPAGGDLARVVTVRLVMPKASLTDASVIFNAAVAAMHF